MAIRRLAQFATGLPDPHDLFERHHGAAGADRAEAELASRLSYFFWSSMPDEELLARAGAGDLQKPDGLIGQARLMLKDDRARGLAIDFAGDWLDFRRFEDGLNIRTLRNLRKETERCLWLAALLPISM